jgi:hypothetical protein
MKTEVRIYAAIAILAVLGGGYYLTTKDSKIEAEKRGTSASKQDLPSIALSKEDGEKVTKIEIVNAEKGKVVLEKKGDAWEIVEPMQAKANQNDVKSLIEGLDDLKITDSIDRGTGAYDQYEVADKKAIHVTVFKGADKALDLFVGKSGTRGQMVRVAGKDGVFAAQGYQAWLYTKEAKNWRDKSILKFEDKDASKVVVENKNGKFTFEKKDGKWVASREKLDKKGELETVEKWEKFEAKKVDDLLRAYKGLNAVDFGDDKQKPDSADTGLADAKKEGGTITIQVGGDTHKLKIGKTQKGSNRFFLKEGGDGTVYVVSSWAADWATAEASKFEAKDKDKKDKKDDKGEDKPAMDLDMGDLQMPDLPEE